MIETPYSKKYKVQNKLNRLEENDMKVLKEIVDHILANEFRSGSPYFGIPSINKLIVQYEEYESIRGNKPLLDKHVVGYFVDINPKTIWKNCGCGGTGNWRVR